eukprot:CAMPEP_0182812138 /NCGR_PEP_ID=MMETSP0006_2-20121128/8646_1 /TAXON_ID=97485 /ORGANISM="Prymnesium parvum, Strain Texoma1" /LENGTH=94 /DNA_ID=CAMNT_0024938147 /DNA_START=693 /DNA_END=979 /DNA_ORIENTATION=+
MTGIAQMRIVARNVSVECAPLHHVVICVYNNDVHSSSRAERISNESIAEVDVKVSEVAPGRHPSGRDVEAKPVEVDSAATNWATWVDVVSVHEF